MIHPDLPTCEFPTDAAWADVATDANRMSRDALSRLWVSLNFLDRDTRGVAARGATKASRGNIDIRSRAIVVCTANLPHLYAGIGGNLDEHYVSRGGLADEISNSAPSAGLDRGDTMFPARVFEGR